jgi:hypothetical protein
MASPLPSTPTPSMQKVPGRGTTQTSDTVKNHGNEEPAEVQLQASQGWQDNRARPSIIEKMKPRPSA